MSRPTLECRLLTVEDAPIFQKIRLHACKEEPASFLEAYEELKDKPDKYFERYFDNGWIVGAFADGKLVGTAGLFHGRGSKTKHKGTVWGVYVTPEMRGLQGAKKMIEMVLEKAKSEGVEIATISTDVSNPITVLLYKSLGFEPYGVEEHIMKLKDGRYIDDVWMLKHLNRS